MAKKQKGLRSVLSNIDVVKEHMVDPNVDHITEFYNMNVIILNLLYSARVNGGIPKNRITQHAAASMTGKSFIGMGVASDAFRKGMNVVIFDTETAFGKDLATNLGIDLNDERVSLIQTNGIEAVSEILLKINDKLTPEERLNTLYIIDSFGALVSSKMVTDKKDGKDVRDMTLTQKQNALANLFLVTKSTFFIVNSLYVNTSGYGEKETISGGGRIRLNSHVIAKGMGRAKDTDSAKNITGHIMKAKSEKTRLAREDISVEYRIKNNGGLDMFYGLLPFALEFGVVVKPKKGWISRPCIDGDKNWRAKDIYCAEFWGPIFQNTDFREKLEAFFAHNSKLDIAQTTIGDVIGGDFVDGGVDSDALDVKDVDELNDIA